MQFLSPVQEIQSQWALLAPRVKVGEPCFPLLTAPGRAPVSTGSVCAGRDELEAWELIGRPEANPRVMVSNAHAVGHHVQATCGGEHPLPLQVKLPVS